MRSKSVRDVMLSLEDYPVVPASATLLDAFHALQQAQESVEGTRQPHRAVLVIDAKGAIAGKVGHLAFLRGLEPNYRRLGNHEALSHAGLSEEFLSSVMESYRLWSDGPEELRQRARTTPVVEVMTPATVHVPEDAPLARAVHELIIHQTLSILVTRRGEVVGILRLSDVFEVMFELLTRE